MNTIKYRLYVNTILSFMKILNMDSPDGAKPGQKVWLVTYPQAEKIVKTWKKNYKT